MSKYTHLGHKKQTQTNEVTTSAKPSVHHKEGEYVSEEVFSNLDEFAHKSENFLEKNSKMLGIIFGALLLIVAGYIAYLKFYVEPNEVEATKQMAAAEKLLNEGKQDEALGGAKAGNNGFADVAEKYASTGAGKVSAYYAGTIEYKKGNYQKAIEYYNTFDSKDDIANAVRFGAIADCYVQLGKNDEALNYFDKAISEADNSGAKVYFLKKAAMLAMNMNKNKEAYDYLKNIKDNYPDVDQSGEIDAYLEKLSYSNGNG